MANIKALKIAYVSKNTSMNELNHYHSELLNRGMYKV